MKLKISFHIYILCFFFVGSSIHGQSIFIPMDIDQSDHLKAYGLVFRHLESEGEVKWLLNYRGGSFLVINGKDTLEECILKNIYCEPIGVRKQDKILDDINDPHTNMSVVELVKAPRIAVYTPSQSLPWDDAVTLALTYAGVPFDKIYDEEVVSDRLKEYDWLHLHHEDFTGQYGKFWISNRNQPWYLERVRRMESTARKLGYSSVSEQKKGVAKKIKEYIFGGGFLFSMCSGTDTFDIALAAEGIDIAPEPFDGDAVDSDAQEKLDYNKSLAFENFVININPYEYEHSDIDINPRLEGIDQSIDFFTLFNFSAKWDPVPTMLTQNHVSSVRGFYGQTTAFRKEKIKESVIILAESPGRGIAKYIHGNWG